MKKSNINPVILGILDEMKLKDNEENYILDALNLEYENTDKKKPRLDDKYLKFVEEHCD